MPYTIAPALLKSLFDNTDAKIFLPKILANPNPLNVTRGRFSVLVLGGHQVTMTVQMEEPPYSTGHVFLPRSAVYYVSQEMLDACEWDETAKMFLAKWTTIANKPEAVR